MTPASVQVLVNPALFGTITDCIDGVPHHVLRFKETVFEPRGTGVLSGSTLRRSSGGYVPTVPPRDQLWQVAVLCCNKRVLQALDQLSATSRYKSSLHVRLVGIVGFAVLYGVNDLAYLDWLYARFSDPEQRWISSNTFDRLARCSTGEGDLAVLKWLLARGYELPASMMDAAAEAGNLALVRFLHEHSPSGCTTRAMDMAARNGHLDVVRFLHEHRTEGCTQAAQGGALANGHLDVLAFLHASRSEGCSASAVSEAAGSGHLACIQFAHEHGFVGFSVWTMSDAAIAGNLSIVQYLHEHRTEGCTLESLFEAEALGHRDVVDFLCRHRPVANPGAVIKEATRRGHARLVAIFWLNTIASPGTLRYEYSSASRSFMELCFPGP